MLDTVEKDAKRGDLIYSEILKEIQRIKKIRTAELKASIEIEAYLRTKVVRIEKQTGSLKEQTNSQNARASDHEKKAKEAIKQISHGTKNSESLIEQNALQIIVTNI